MQFNMYMYEMNNREYLNSIKPIDFTCSTDNKGVLENINYSNRELRNTSNTTTYILITSQDGDRSFISTNKKWFINLTNTDIPRDVSDLLQLGERFSLLKRTWYFRSQKNNFRIYQRYKKNVWSSHIWIPDEDLE